MKTSKTKLNSWRSLLSLASTLLVALSLTACGGGGGGGGTPLAVTVSPKTATVTTALSLQMSAAVTGTSAVTVNWSVNGIDGGNATVGTIDVAGLYTAPAVKPAAPSTVTITAKLASNTAVSGSATITIADLALAGPGGGYFGNFSTTGAMKSARSNHTATLLTSGDLLVSGGIGSSGAAIAATELYRPKFGNFTSVGALITPRAYHTATMLQNGKVLVTGGIDANNNVLAQTEIYDPATGRFTTTGSMTTGRTYHTATQLSNGKILIAGGSETSDLTAGTALASLELYDPASGTFSSPAATMSSARFAHSATRLKDGKKVLLAGGVDSGGGKLALADIYDPETGTISATTGAMVTGRWLHTATLLTDGRVLISGGSSGTIAGLPPSAIYTTATELYDPTTGMFISALGQLIDTRGFFTTTLLADSTLLSSGGFGLLSGATDGSSLATAELFTADISSAAYTGSMPQQRANHTATMLPASGKVLVLGGGGYSSGSFTLTNSALLYQ